MLITNVYEGNSYLCEHIFKVQMLGHGHVKVNLAKRLLYGMLKIKIY